MTISSSLTLTPMMQQWAAAKSQHKDAVLLFRMGDFYELFGEDAILCSPILDLALTSRDKDKSGLKMAGFPHHCANNYIAKLVESGHKVAICEQLEDPKATKGIVKRGVTEVISPGTIIDGEDSTASSQNYLVSLLKDKLGFAIAAIDFASASFLVTSSLDENKIGDEILRLRAKELLILSTDHEAVKLAQKLKQRLDLLGGLRIEQKFSINNSPLNPLLANYQDSLNSTELSALALSYSYILELKGQIPPHIGLPVRYSIDNQLLIDEDTAENLALLPKKKGSKHNLFSILNYTKTSMAKRMLARNIAAPSTDLAKIEDRQQIVAEFLDNAQFRDEFRKYLAQFHDLEKLTALCASNKISPRGLAHIRDSLDLTQSLNKLSKSSKALQTYLKISSGPNLDELLTALSSSLNKEPPMNLKDPGTFVEGYNLELDALNNLNKNAQDMLLAIELRERQETGIYSLKIKYTRVFGYYIEVTKTHLDKVPGHYHRKQTIANGERFTTSELSDLEIRLNSAKENVAKLEQVLFEELRQKVTKYSQKLMTLAKTIAFLDMLAGFAELASFRNYVRPKILAPAKMCLNIIQGRHPIIEEIAISTGSFFVPNDFVLDHEYCSLALITGPNMAGKSTIMRQTALIQIMAQLGSFVPAKSAQISICDAIFARVGASDDLALGRSTFMVEMSETAHILNNATKHSLILLDEIGRGTSTYDGMSIAQAVAEYIHEELGTRTIFATHYHELSKLEENFKNIKNFHVAIEEKQDQIRFLYALTYGPAQKSFGIQVAKLAALPGQVIDRAEDILKTLEDRNIRKQPLGLPQLDLFELGCQSKIGNYKLDSFIDKLDKLDLNRLTPLQALNKLSSIQNSIRAKR